MRPRQFQRRVDGFEWHRRQEARKEERQFFNALNATGLAWHGKEWNWISPNEEDEDEPFEDRWERAERQEQRYIDHLREQE